MARKRRSPRSRRPETLIRRVEITGIQAGASISAGAEKGAEPELSGSARVELTGLMDEPIRGIREVEIVVYPPMIPGPARIRSLGSGWCTQSSP